MSQEQIEKTSAGAPIFSSNKLAYSHRKICSKELIEIESPNDYFHPIENPQFVVQSSTEACTVVVLIYITREKKLSFELILADLGTFFSAKNP